MERYLVKPAYYTCPKTERRGKLYLVYDTERPIFDSCQNMTPRWVVDGDNRFALPSFMQTMLIPDDQWQLGPSVILRWPQADAFLARVM